MTGLLAAIAIGGGLASALLTQRSVLGSRVAKILASTAMVAIVATGVPVLNGYTISITAGLVASWIGDLALSFRSQRAFLGGLISFAIAHALYTAGFFARSQMDLVSVAVSGAVMAITAAAILRWLSPHVPRRLQTPVAVYVGIISVMVVASFGTSGTLADPRIPSAAVLFAISDVLVARQQFVTPDIANRLFGLPIYYTAQVLFALTVIFP
jgi:uncharacterized membrane protein YhhN